MFFELFIGLMVILKMLLLVKEKIEKGSKVVMSTLLKIHVLLLQVNFDSL